MRREPLNVRTADERARERRDDVSECMRDSVADDVGALATRCLSRVKLPRASFYVAKNRFCNL